MPRCAQSLFAGLVALTAAVGAPAAGSAMAPSATFPAITTATTFSGGADGWQSIGLLVRKQGGLPGAAAQIQLPGAFGIDLHNAADARFAVGLGTAKIVTVSVDVKSTRVDQFLGDRTLIVQFRSHALARRGAPYTDVWCSLGTVSPTQPWTSYAVSFIPGNAAPPAGCGGEGAGAAVLPRGISFNDVLRATDEIALTTVVPGFFYTDNNYAWGVDNIRLRRDYAPLQ